MTRVKSMESKYMPNLNESITKHNTDDEIDLFELWGILVKQKAVIGICVMFSTIAALIYVLITPPVFKSKSILLAPTLGQLQGLQVSGIMTISGTTAFNLFKRHVNSNQIRRQIFEENELLSSPVDRPGANKEDLFEEFNKKLSFAVSTSKKGKMDINSLTLTFEHSNSDFTAELIKKLIHLSNSKSLKELSLNFQSKIDFKKDEISRDIKLLQKKEEVKRQDLITRLKEAIVVSQKTGKVTPSIAFNPEINSLYYRSPLSLRAEIDQLSKRKSDDPFISGLREKQNELNRLKLLRINTKDTSTVLIDQEAIVPHKKIRPRRTLIVFFALFLGAFLGVFIAFLRNFLKKVNYKD